MFDKEADMNTKRMPALFLGHGSPMNVLETNHYTKTWQQLGHRIGKPRAILCISAHWYTQGSAVTAMQLPKTIHDFRGFPTALQQMEYPAKGSPELAVLIQDILEPVDVHLDRNNWGLDHGSWGLLVKMYPDADVPVVQLSIDATKPAQWHYELGKQLAQLRDEGILILGSGNVVHNLPAMKRAEIQPEPYPWAISFENYVRDNLLDRSEPNILTQALEREDGKLSNPSPEHYLPLLYVMGAWDGKESVIVPIDGIELGSLSMLSVMVG